MKKAEKTGFCLLMGGALLTSFALYSGENKSSDLKTQQLALKPQSQLI